MIRFSLPLVAALAISAASLSSVAVQAADPAPPKAAASASEDGCMALRKQKRAEWEALSPEQREQRKAEAKAKWDAVPEADKAALRQQMEERLMMMPADRRQKMLDEIRSNRAG